METPQDVTEMLRLKASRRLLSRWAARRTRRYLRAGGWVGYKQLERKSALNGLQPWLCERLQQHRVNADVVR
jgi:hypothetical protein